MTTPTAGSFEPVAVDVVELQQGVEKRRARLARGTQEHPTIEVPQSLDACVITLALGASVRRRRIPASFGNRFVFVQRLIRDLVSATSDGASTFGDECTELRSLLVDAIHHVATAADQSRISLRAAAPVFVDLDARHLDRVISRILADALQFAPTGTITVTLDVHRNGARISVRDQASEESQPDVRFIFEHARPQNQSQPAPALATRKGLLIGAALPHAPALASMLASEGMTTDRAMSRSDALRSIRRTRPDAIVIDFDMKDGQELLRELRHVVPTAVIVVAASRNRKALGTTEPLVVSNPIDAGELFAIVKRRLAR